MTQQTFETIMHDQLTRCTSTLTIKRQEYAPDVDVLHNFKSAAGLLGCPQREALAGMMLKHTVSLYDMCRENECQASGRKCRHTVMGAAQRWRTSHENTAILENQVCYLWIYKTHLQSLLRLLQQHH